MVVMHDLVLLLCSGSPHTYTVAAFFLNNELQCKILVIFTFFEVLEGPVHGGNELETASCKLRHNAQHKNIAQHRDMCCCNNYRGEIFSAATVHRQGVSNIGLRVLGNFQSGYMCGDCRRYAPVPVTFTHAVLANYLPLTATATGVRYTQKPTAHFCSS
jgi:hypothetical protein